MINYDKKFGGETQKVHLNELSLISKIIPFVEINMPLKQLSICKYRPFILIRPILGFTLVELMVTVAVAAILMAIAVPNMRSVIQNTRISNQINELTSDLNFARSEAIKRGSDTTVSNVTICKSDNPTAATPTCNATALGWDMGRIIFIDGTPAVGATAAIPPNGDHEAAEPLLRIREVLDGANTLTANDTSGAGGAFPNAQNLVVYTRTGGTTIVPSPPAVPAAEFNLCDARGANYGRRLTIGPTGRATVIKPATGC